MASDASLFVIEKYSTVDGDPSLAPAGEALEAVLKLSGIQYEANETGNHNRSPNGQLPFGYFRDTVLSDYAEVLGVIHQQKSHIDSHLPSYEVGRLKVFTNSLLLRFHPLYLYSIWADDETFINFTYDYVKSLHPFPLNIFLARMERTRMKGTLENIGLTDAGVLQEKAARYFAELSQSLGESDFFFGEKFSSFDVLFYNYILSLRSSKVKTHILLEQLEAHQNLHKHIERCAQSFGDAPIPAPVSFQPPLPTTPADTEGSTRETAEEEKSKTKTKYNKIFVGLTIVALLIHKSSRLVDADFDDDFVGFAGESDDDDDE